MNYYENHVLEKVGNDPLSFMLRAPDHQRIQSTMIIFSAEGIVICGDLCPCRNGVISDYGYGIDWFSTKKSDGDLCEKFLRRDYWDSEAAIVELCECAADDYHPDEASDLEDLISDIRGGGIHSAGALYERLADIGIQCDDGPPGDCRYDPHDAALLVGCHRAFVRLMETGGVRRNGLDHLPANQFRRRQGRIGNG